MKIEYEETSKDLQVRIDIHGRYGAKDIDAWMLGLLKPEADWRILDIACGGGKQLQAFHKATAGRATLTGVDVSTELLEQARRLNESLGSPFTLRQMDFDRPFPFENGTFDLLSCCFAIYYASDVRHTLTEAHRVVRPGGLLFTTGPMPENKRVFYDIIREATGKPIPPMPGSSRYGSEVLQTMRDIFARVEVHIFENPLVFERVEPYLEYTRASLSEDRKLWTRLFSGPAEFEATMARIAEVATRRIGESGTLVMTKVVGGFVATK